MKHSSKTVFFGLALILMVLFVASQIQAEDLVDCAVSGKEIKKSEAKGSMEYNGKTYYFCCENCQDSFVKDPEKYINSEPGEHHEHGEHMEHGEHAENSMTCPVSGETFNKSEDTESMEYNGKTYYFCCAGCKEKFVKDPEKYVKSNGDKIICPVMGNEVKDPEKAASSVYQGKTYYFCCPGCKEPFDKDPEKYLKKK